MGKIEIDHTGSGGGITLSSDGTSLLLGGTAIGGSALELYAENPSSPTAPSATGTNAVAIGNNASSSNTLSVAIGHNSIASNDYAFAIGAFTDATGERSLALGYLAQAVTGQYATAISRSYASGTDSFAAAIANNTSSYGATGANSIAMGFLAKATGTNSICLGRDSTSSGSRAVNFGSFSTASGSYSAVLSGVSNSATQRDAVVLNGTGSTSDVVGKVAWGNHGLAGCHGGMYRLFSDTTNATPEALTTNNSTAGTTNQIILPNNSAYAFHGTIVARQQAAGGTASAAWKIEGLIRREGSAGTTVLVNSATTVLDNTPSWGMALSADTTNGGLAITATGAASTNIRWVATIHTSEVTYA